MLQITFNPGLTLTGFQTTWPSSLNSSHQGVGYHKNTNTISTKHMLTKAALDITFLFYPSDTATDRTNRHPQKCIHT